jgi:SAM-dependent methyltransferase
MKKNSFVVTDKHGKCLCIKNKPEFKVVTTNTREGRGLWEKCIKCGLVINRSGVDKFEVENYYNSTYQDLNSFSSGKVLSPQEHYDIAIESMRPVAKQLLPYLKPNWRVMDIGAATGEFLNLIKDQVDYCLGVELNETYCQFMRNELGIDATSEDYFTLDADEGFDMIVINATIDHMFNSLAVLDKIIYDLKPGGLLYIQSPNDNQALRTFLPEPSRTNFERFMYQRAHYLSFSMNTLQRALKQVGFRIIESSTRHDYTLKNFLQWYYLGKPQKDMYDAKVQEEFFTDVNDFSVEMNQLLVEADFEFHNILRKYEAGELLCIVAEKIEQ